MIASERRATGLHPASVQAIHIVPAGAGRTPARQPAGSRRSFNPSAFTMERIAKREWDRRGALRRYFNIAFWMG